MFYKQNFRQLAALFAIIVTLGISLLYHWEPGGESWGYWFAARLFSETGTFIVLGRSPLYALYLNGFRWLGYPDSVTVEYLVTGFIVGVSLLWLFASQIGIGQATFASLMWVLYLQIAEPPVQKLALACCCWALMARRLENERFGRAASYALFGFAYLFRPTFGIFLPLFALYDVWHIFKRGGKVALARVLRPRLGDWPVWTTLSLLIWFALCQSPHPSNNMMFATTTYFPTDAKNAGDFAFISGANNSYIREHYGSFTGRDFYFTNRELFGGATTTMSAIRANPSFFVEQLGRNIKNLLKYSVVDWTELGAKFYFGRSSILSLIASIAIFFGAFRASQDLSMRLLVIGNILLLFVNVVFGHYRQPFYAIIPVLILSASWYGTQVRDFLMAAEASKALFWTGIIGVGLLSLYLILRFGLDPTRPLTSPSAIVITYVIALGLVVIGRYGNYKIVSSGRFGLACLAVPVALAFLSTGASRWAILMQSIGRDLSRGEIRVLENRGTVAFQPQVPQPDMKASFRQLQSLVRECKGVISYEHNFVAGFINVPLDRVYDVWEIPPFGRLDNSDYNGLRPDRIDCVLVSSELATGIGEGTNFQIRYLNYIKPYAEQLQDMGAKAYEIPKFGKAIALAGSK